MTQAINVAETTTEVKAPRITKKSQALSIVAGLGVGSKRKDQVDALISGLGMSKAAAGTYVQNIRSGKWADAPAAE